MLSPMFRVFLEPRCGVQVNRFRTATYTLRKNCLEVELELELVIFAVVEGLGLFVVVAVITSRESPCHRLLRR